MTMMLLALLWVLTIEVIQNSDEAIIKFYTARMDKIRLHIFTPEDNH